MSKKSEQTPSGNPEPSPKESSTPSPKTPSPTAPSQTGPDAALDSYAPAQVSAANHDTKKSHPGISRRILLTGGLAGVGIAAAGTEAAKSVWDSHQVSTLTHFPAAPEGPTHVNIIAHPDDDLFFINPRLTWAQREDFNLINICLTAGESNGRNGSGAPTTPDFAGYSAARNQGLRRAWSYMVTEDSEHPWERQSIELSSGQQVELCTLEDHPGIQMVFVSMWTDLGKVWGGEQRLMGLWEHDLDAQHILHVTDTTVDHGGKFTRDDVQSMLQGLLEHYEPSSVAVLDADPDWIEEPKGADQTGYSDHIDHTAAALFSWAAIREWGGRASIESYRGYYNRRWPRNLSQIDRVAKGQPLDVYSWLNGTECPDTFGCGDLKITTLGTGSGYGASTHPRHSAGLALLDTEEDSPIPVVVRGMRLTKRIGEEWEPIGGNPVLPSITATGDHLLAIAPDFRPHRDRQRRDVVHYHVPTDTWNNLGNVETRGDDARHAGTPGATTLPDGSCVVAVRCSDLQLAVRSRNGDGGWSEWLQLAGDYIQPDIAGVTNRGGEPEFYGTSENDLVVWRRSGDDWNFERLELGEHASSPAALWLPEGPLVLAAREAETGAVLVHLFDDDEWHTCQMEFNGGIMAPTLAVSAQGTLMVAADDDRGKAAAAITDVAGLRAGEQPVWPADGPLLARQPRGWFDSSDRLHLVGLGLDGILQHTSQEAPGRMMSSQWREFDGGDTPES